MITHLSSSRGVADHGWLKSRHTFSFGDYYDPNRMGFGLLRVINDDAVAPGMGFGSHPHRDMEIVSIPLQGALQHRDSEGNSSLIRKGVVQLMSAGSGIVHSEYNPSETEEVKFLQIWVRPKLLGIRPRYEQKAFVPTHNSWTLVVSPNGEHGSVTMNQDAWFSLADLAPGHTLTYRRRRSENGLYLFVIEGGVTVNGEKLEARDAVGVSDRDVLDLVATARAELLLIDVPMA